MLRNQTLIQEFFSTGSTPIARNFTARCNVRLKGIMFGLSVPSSDGVTVYNGIQFLAGIFPNKPLVGYDSNSFPLPNQLYFVTSQSIYYPVDFDFRVGDVINYTIIPDVIGYNATVTLMFEQIPE